MATLSITKSYLDGTLLTASQLDDFCDSVETFFNSTKVCDDNIQSEGITANLKILAGSISAGKIAASAVTTAKFEAGAVTASKIASGAATNAKFASGAITAAKIADDCVTEDLIADTPLATTASGAAATTSSTVQSLTTSGARFTGTMLSASSDTTNYNSCLRGKLGSMSSTGAVHGSILFSAGLSASNATLKISSQTMKYSIFLPSTGTTEQWAMPGTSPFLCSESSYAGSDSFTFSGGATVSVSLDGAGSLTYNPLNSSLGYKGDVVSYEF